MADKTMGGFGLSGQDLGEEMQSPVALSKSILVVIGLEVIEIIINQVILGFQVLHRF
jgi:hypothetical protein